MHRCLRMIFNELDQVPVEKYSAVLVRVSDVFLCSNYLLYGVMGSSNIVVNILNSSLPSTWDSVLIHSIQNPRKSFDVKSFNNLNK